MDKNITDYIYLIYKVMNNLHCYPDEESQDEMFFEGLLGLDRAMKTYKPGTCKEITYYYTCIRNAILTKFKKKTCAKRDYKKDLSLESTLIGTLKLEDVLASDEDIERNIIRAEQLNYICDALNKTKNTRYKTFLCEFYGIGQPRLKLKEIALKHHTTHQNVCQSIKQGIRFLKRKVMKEYERKNK